MTRYAVVVGDPVEHSLSPAIHNAAFAATGLDWRFLALCVPTGRAVDAVGAMRSLGLAGMSVTMPHKEPVAALVDELTAEAAELRAVNCVLWRDATLVGDNTDGQGFLRSLQRDVGFEPAGRSAVVLGAGGAARAVISALGRAGAASVAVVNRTPDRAEAAALLAMGAGLVAPVEACDGADLVVNATPVRPDGSSPVPAELLHAGQIVVDIVYHPRTTPLLDAARSRGASVANGLGMLVHQAAAAFERWTGESAPTDAMAAAAAAELARRP